MRILENPLVLDQIWNFCQCILPKKQTVLLLLIGKLNITKSISQSINKMIYETVTSKYFQE